MKKVEEVEDRQSGFATLYREKKELQRIWNSISINNSWQTLLIHAPHSLAALEKLVVDSLRKPSQGSVSEPSRCRDTVAVKRCRFAAARSRSDSGDGANSSMDSPSPAQEDVLRPRVVEIMAGARSALHDFQASLLLIAVNLTEIPSVVVEVLSLISKEDVRLVEAELFECFKRLHSLVERCADAAFNFERIFRDAKLLKDHSSIEVGRRGFLWLTDVRHLWEKLLKFGDEVSKLIEFAVDPACNALIASILRRIELAGHSSNCAIKPKKRMEIYRSALATVAYSLIVRHVSQAYVDYSTEVLIPQVLNIAQYSLICNSEAQLTIARKHFGQSVNAQEKEVSVMVQSSRSSTRRRSVLELDAGLDLYLSDISNEINCYLSPIADFLTNHLVNPVDSNDSPRSEAKPSGGLLNRIKQRLEKKPRSFTM